MVFHAFYRNVLFAVIVDNTFFTLLISAASRDVVNVPKCHKSDFRIMSLNELSSDRHFLTPVSSRREQFSSHLKNGIYWLCCDFYMAHHVVAMGTINFILVTMHLHIGHIFVGMLLEKFADDLSNGKFETELQNIIGWAADLEKSLIDHLIYITIRWARFRPVHTRKWEGKGQYLLFNTSFPCTRTRTDYYLPL